MINNVLRKRSDFLMYVFTPLFNVYLQTVVYKLETKSRLFCVKLIII